MINSKFFLNFFKFYFILFLLLLTVYSYSDYSYFDNNFGDNSNIGIKKDNIIPFKILKNEQINTSLNNGVLLQAYYWLVEDNGEWWNVLKKYLPEFSANGINGIWLPPPSKTRASDTARGGYEPYDYYDLGEYDQQGRIRTRYGTKSQLVDLIKTASEYGIKAISDIVINHNNGGGKEWNPIANAYTNTNFMNVSSGLFPRNYTNFHPWCGETDSGSYGAFPDLCHGQDYVRSEILKWAKWLRDDIGYYGWRFDTADLYSSSMVKDWMNAVGGWGVAEYWPLGGLDVDRNDISGYIKQTGSVVNSFDYPLLTEFAHMDKAKGGYNMSDLARAGLSGIMKDNAVAFITNHDTDRVQDLKLNYYRNLAYAYILTQESDPSIFWKDYFDIDLQPHLKTLLKIRSQYARGNTSILFTSDDLYISQRNGDPGLILALNDNPTEWQYSKVRTKWKNTILRDLTGQSQNSPVDENGFATLFVPPRSYSIYSTGEKIANLFPLPTLSDQNNSYTIPNIDIKIDGYLDSNWGRPLFIDSRTDAGESLRDLANLYISSNNTHLNIGISYGSGEWKLDNNAQIGIAFDINDGGSREDPGLHQNIKWAGKKIPDYMIYLETDSTQLFNDVYNNATLFSYNNELEDWDRGINIDKNQFASNSELNFVEISIPLKTLNLDQGGSFSIMAFSSEEGKPAAADSVPQDRFTDGYGNEDSWLTLVNELSLEIDEDYLFKSTDKSISGTSNENDNNQVIGFEFFSIVMLPIIFIYRKKKMVR